MANIIAQRVDSEGVFVETSDGSTFVVSTQRIKTLFDAATGTIEERKAQVIAQGFAAAVAALGSDMIDPTRIVFDFNTETGEPLVLEFR